METLCLSFRQVFYDLLPLLDRICWKMPHRTIYYCSGSYIWALISLIARFLEPTWSPSGADRSQVGPMMAPWSLLSGLLFINHSNIVCHKSCRSFNPSYSWKHKRDVYSCNVHLVRISGTLFLQTGLMAWCYKYEGVHLSTMVDKYPGYTTMPVHSLMGCAT